MTCKPPESGLTWVLQTAADLAARKLFLFGEVDTEAAYKFIVAIQQMDATDGVINIVINSDGGEEPAGYAIYDAIMGCRNQVVIEGYGEVCSIAAAIFQAGDIRRLAPNAQFMIHAGDVSPGESVNQNILIDMAEKVQNDSARYYEILSESSNLTADQVAAACEHDTYYSAEEALTAGFCDEILVPLKVKKKPRKRRKKQ